MIQSPKTIQNPRCSPQLYQTNSGRMAQTRSSPEIGLTVQFTHLLHTQETRPKTQDRARLSGTQPELPHQQIFNEGNHRIHQRHWPIKLQHFLNAGPHFRHLADEARRKISASNGFHYPRKRTISMVHLTDGTAVLSSLFSNIDGRCASKYSKCDRLH